MICFFNGQNKSFYVAEYGHSVLSEDKNIGTRIRETYLLHIVVSDTCRFSDFDAIAGQAFLIGKNLPHDFCVKAGYEHFWFSFDGERLPQLFSVFGISENKHMIFQISEFARVKEILYQSFDKTAQSKSECDAKSALLSVLPYLCTDASQNFSDIARAKLFLERNFQHRITMQQTANYVNLSEKHFCRKFKKAYAMPPQKYLLSVRMKRARKLLQESDLSVKAISESVGYLSQQTFSQVYKSYFGIPPKYTKYIDIKQTRNS